MDPFSGSGVRTANNMEHMGKGMYSRKGKGMHGCNIEWRIENKMMDSCSIVL